MILIITETLYLKLTIKPHKLYYKYNLLGSAVDMIYIQNWKLLLQQPTDQSVGQMIGESHPARQ